MHKHPLVSLEGNEKTGKSTQTALLINSLNNYYGEDSFVTFKYPGQTELGKELRRILIGDNEIPAMNIPDEYTRQQLFAADLRATTVQLVIPALQNGQGVVVDRFLASNFIYSTRGCGIPPLDAIKFLEPCLPASEYGSMWFCNVLLDAPVEALRQRWTYDDYGDQFDDDYYQRVRDGYLWLAEKGPDRWMVINSEGSVQEVHQKIFNSVTNFIDKTPGILNAGISKEIFDAL